MARLSALILLSVPSLAAAFSPPTPPTFSRCHALAKPGASKMPLLAAKTFAVTDEDLGAPVELQRAWFQQFGFAEPGPPPKKNDKAPAKGGKAKPQKTGGFGAAQSKLECAPPSRDLVSVLRAEVDGAALSKEGLAELGAEARRTIEEHLPVTGAVLLRNLPMRSAEEFAAFWQGCKEEAPALEEGRYISLGPSHGRDRMSGIDMATNVPPQFLLLCHNELCYNPQTVGRIGLFCIQDAKEGGETIIARNKDLSRGVPATAASFLQEHGGIEYSREFFDARNPPKANLLGAQKQLGSWQAKCALPDTAGREEADTYFKEMGFDTSQLTWNEDGILRIANYHPGFIKDPESGEDVWWNIAHTGSLKTVDGTPFPKKMISEIQRTGWDHTYAFKLQPGDWLMLDNMRIQHGRLPFQADPAQKRTLLTVYSHPRPSY